MIGYWREKTRKTPDTILNFLPQQYRNARLCVRCGFLDLKGRAYKRCPHCHKKYKKPNPNERAIIQLVLKKKPFFRLKDIAKVTGLTIFYVKRAAYVFGLNYNYRKELLSYPVVYKGYTRPALLYMHLIRVAWDLEMLPVRFPKAVEFGREQTGF